jgi:hypothetical protein
MKKKIVEVPGEDILSTEVNYEGGFGFSSDKTFTASFTTKKFVGPPEALKLFTEVDVPETLKEFRELHDLSKEELLQWLNNNYKK